MGTSSSRFRILILFAHPALERSRVNRELVSSVRNLEGVTFHDLYEEYPEFDVDPDREQALLLEHDVIVMQHPFYWYSTPAIIKQWEDLVLEHGWAYGANGRMLSGKRLMSAITTGGGADAYMTGGHNGRTIREFLAPIEQTARLCRMEWLPPFVVHGTHGFKGDEPKKHAADYRRVIEALRDDRFDPSALEEQDYVNSNLDSVIQKGSD